MRRCGIRQLKAMISVLGLLALLMNANVGPVRAQEATPIVEVTPIPTPTQPAPIAAEPAATPTDQPVDTPGTPSAPMLALDTTVSTVPSISATDFSPASSTFSFPQGYSAATTTATVTLSATGSVADIAPWQLTIEGDPQHILVCWTSPSSFTQMDFSRLSFDGLGSPVTGVTADNSGQALSDYAGVTLQIAHGDNSGFTSGTPNTLSFDISLLVSPPWSGVPDCTYSGGLILTISAVPSAAP